MSSFSFSLGSTKGLIFSVISCSTMAVSLVACNGIIGTRDLTYDADASADSGSAQACVADLQTDKANCGACGQDCTNGNCAAGVCTLVDQILGVGGIDLSSGNVYVATEDGHVESCATNGCSGGATILYTSKINPNVAPDEPELQPTRIHVSNGVVYVSNDKSDDADGFSGDLTAGVYSINASGTATRVTPTQQAYDLEFNISPDGTTLYWGSNIGAGFADPDVAGEGAFVCTLGNCTATQKTIDKNLDFYDSMFLPNGAFVWASDDGVHYCDAPPTCDGATVLFVPGAPNAWPQSLAYDDTTNLLLIGIGHASPPESDTVVSCPATDIACNPTNVATGLYLPRGLAAGGGFVYIADSGADDPSVPPDGQVVKVPLNKDGTGGTPIVIAKGLSAPNRIIVDAQSVYWTNEGIPVNDGEPAPGSIMKAPR